MTERITNLQRWITDHGCPITIDGKKGPETRNAIIEVFRNTTAPAATPGEKAMIAAKHGFNPRAMMAVAQVESGGGGWDDKGLLKCLWERHYLWRRIKLAVPFLSNPSPGGYTMDADKDGICDSWEKLADAALLPTGFNVAAECASFGKFQVMGAHWKHLGYDSVADMIWGLSRTEVAHYELFARFIVKNGLRDALNRVSGNPQDCLAIARGYNGKGQKGYDGRIATAWRRLG